MGEKVAETAHEAQTHGVLDLQKEPQLKRLKRWEMELGKQFWDLANSRRGRALYATLLTELDAVPIYMALRVGETAAQSGNSPVRPLFDASRSAGTGTSNAIQSALNSVSPNAGTNAINAIHNLIQWLGGPVQVSAGITMITAVVIDYAVYFLGITAVAVGVKKYFQRQNKKKASKETESD